ncbi:hypothetical protein [Lacticaseibacillus brantae]|uniref:Rhodopsin n=1 Tax=Lacticaseibacillus brantae DSM 23927 TaxID=1423727 RepID=A0A0R2B705_9LACO|nr:hypothetical protein [Lacticaseibacillus brantae]KRM71878.1 hypothetical protein FC34_GL000854 [Lacticaseibacillus brantae DSM 23927]
MRSLFIAQWWYLWQLIRRRFIVGLGLVASTAVFMGQQVATNPRSGVFTLFFAGTSLTDIAQGHVQLPILWFVFFLTPTLIFVGVWSSLLQHRWPMLRALMYTRVQIGLVNFGLILAAAVAYSGLILAAIFLSQWGFHGHDPSGLSPNGYMGWYWLVVAVLIFLLMIQYLVSLLNPRLDLVVISSLLVISAYSSWNWNPLAMAMLLQQQSALNDSHLFFVAVMDVIFCTIILIVEHQSKIEGG